MLSKTRIAWVAPLALGMAVGVGITVHLDRQAVAEEAAQPTSAGGATDALPRGRTAAAIVDGQYPASYFPNTELLGADEMRITALGTGMPNQTRAAVSISYLVELGNGDKFLFDIGSGALANLFSLRPDFSKLDKVFASHLHVDHVGDFMGLHIGGWLSGRYTPIHFYGPTGSTPELGSKAFVEGMQKGYAWDLATRSGALPDKGAQIAVHEFDYKQENEVVYQENGVTIRSWPAIHSLDGSVSYSLEWNGLKYVFGGDTYPNKWYAKYAKTRISPPMSASSRPRLWPSISAGI
jgi:ribonuclease Z